MTQVLYVVMTEPMVVVESVDGQPGLAAASNTYVLTIFLLRMAKELSSPVVTGYQLSPSNKSEPTRPTHSGSTRDLGDVVR